MDPEASGFVLGLLFGAAKVSIIGAVGFGVAWWRARARIRDLEAAQAQPSLTAERLDRLEQGLDYVASQLDRVVDGQSDLQRRLPPAPSTDGQFLPANTERPITPH
jgi:hypothetical protein